MTLPSAEQEITFANIQTEFGGSHPISISEYYRDPGGVVTGNNTNIDTGGNGNEISMSHFAGATFRAYATWSVIGGGGGGGYGTHSGGGSGSASSGSSSSLSGSGFTTVTDNGGSGGTNGGGPGW